MKKILLIFFLCGIICKTFAQQWQMLGGGVLNPNNSIFTVCLDPTGNIYAAGAFTNSSGNYYVAKWNGTKLE